MSTPFRLLLPRQFLDEMVAQAQAELPNECCGCLAGTIGADGIARIERRYPLINAEASPISFQWEPKSHFAAVRDMRSLRLDILAIYHSHPVSDPIPSGKDRACYDQARPLLGEVMHFIVGMRENPPRVRGWWLERDSAEEADWEVI